MSQAQTGLTPDQLNHISITSWVIKNRMVTENEKPIEFSTHRCLIDPYSDMSPDQVVKKSSQIGWTTLEIVKSAYLCIEYGFNVIYVLPTRTVVKDFVAPKVDKLYRNNPIIMENIKKDSENLKQLGSRFMYFRGAFSDTEAITISADIVVGDEYDRSNQQVLETYESRLDASEWGFYHKFSNPSLPAFGVDAMFEASDQMHWFITCHHCGHEWYIDWEPTGELNHFVQITNNQDGLEDGFYACGRCHKELSDADRQNGRWVPKYPGRHRRGYWINQLMMPYKHAPQIIAKSKGDTSVFYNFTLGKAYQPADMSISREMIINNLVPGAKIEIGQQYALGVDNGVVKHWVLGNIGGVVSHGETKDWGKIEELIKTYKPLTVIDANPYPNMPFKLVKAYPGLVYANYYVEDKDNKGTTRWLEGTKAGITHIDKTRAFDAFVADLVNNNFNYYQTLFELENSGYIAQCGNIMRIIQEDSKDRQKAYWVKKNPADHYANATIYMNAARQRLLALKGAGVTRSQPPVPKVPKGVAITQEGGVPHDLNVMEVARKASLKGRNWRAR